ncbi:hypothetical protein CN931_23860 [Bacillus sp. AFS054943]|uniref:Uncharacterized protein n=1 Tax=Bacillus cereus TaxID=1396 RepID=A0A2C1LPP2_BACCE|nr:MULTISPECIES: hypothetical protein [Bacillus]PGL78052.1 hypothetical protein CN931_23860 [Bacillus sp. AFS054943]PGT99838.1 hypothetical protein COD19_18060 [Bacillus cereus]
MNIIDFEAAKKRKQNQNEQQTITIPVVERIFVENGEVKYETSGEKTVPGGLFEK